MITPRFVECFKHDVDDGNTKHYKWDSSKITVEESLADDLLMLQNVFEGQIISPHIYPLIFDSKCQVKEISLRSLEFYREVLNDKTRFNALTVDERLYFMIGLRDLFVASCRGFLSVEETDLFKAIVELIDSNDEDIIKKNIQNLDVTPYPTSQNKMVKFVPHNSQTPVDEFFIRNELGLLMVFVDPGHLSYHNFENIINLDSLFANTKNNFKINNFEKIQGSEVYTFNMKDDSLMLLSLDKYGLYIPPFNSLSRGGQRFIFSSETLSQGLTKAIKENIPDKELINDKFRFVNYVFRYNKFKPDDKKFASHYDTPYHDSSRKHYSKYTIILYLTSGVADPVLSINQGQVKINDINTSNGIQGIIFDQQYEHEGKSFINTDKIFLRSELVFEYDEKELNFDDSLSKQFNIACYMTKQSIFNPEVEKYASDVFNQVAAARCGYNSNDLDKKFQHLLILKKYEGISFITNGYDYWFTKSISLQDSALMVILDHFNCKFDNQENFNKLTYSQVTGLKCENIKEIFGILLNPNRSLKIPPKNTKNKENLKRKANTDFQTEFEKSKSEQDNVASFIKMQTEFLSMEIEENKDDKSDEDYDEDEDEDEDEDGYDSDNGSHCCDFHCHDNFDPYKCSDVMNFYRREENKKLTKLQKLNDEFPIVIFDKKLTISKKNIEITDKSIIFNQQIPFVNFAACWVDTSISSEASYLRARNQEAVAYTNIPPINYIAYENGYHLRVELFNNKFLRRSVFPIKTPYIITTPQEGVTYNEDSDEENEEDEEDEEIGF